MGVVNIIQIAGLANGVVIEHELLSLYAYSYMCVFNKWQYFEIKMCVPFCNDVVILNLPCNPLEKMTRKYVTEHWQTRARVNRKVSFLKIVVM